MEFDLATAKLVAMFTAVNLVASLTGFLVAVVSDPLIGLATLILTLFLLPVPVQYFFLKRAGQN